MVGGGLTTGRFADDACTSVIDARSNAAPAAPEAAEAWPEQRFGSVTELLPGMPWFDDLTGRVDLLNRRGRQFFGVALEPGRAPSWERLIHPDDLRDFLHTLDESQRIRSSLRVEARALRADGSWCWTETFTNPWLSADDETLGILGTSFELGPRDATEAARASCEVRLRRTLEAAEVGLLEHSLDTGLVSVSRETQRLLGLAVQGDVPLTALVERVHPDDRTRLREALRAAVDERRPIAIDCRPARPPEGARWLQLVGRTQGGRFRGALLDVTRRREAEDALREADRSKSSLIACLSHELRSPLAALRNALLLLERTVRPEGQARLALEVLQRQSSLLCRLVDDLLDVTRVTHGKLELARARLDLSELARQAVDDARATFTQRGLRLEVSLPREPLWIEADAERLRQMVGNLLENARKFTPCGKSVRVRVRADEGCALLEVADEGIGLEPEELSRVFAPFAQARGPRHEQSGGLGLGLAVVKELAALHGGEVFATSEGKDRGSTFTLRLPAART
jgi:PAS domain S-box-containing protein